MTTRPYRKLSACAALVCATAAPGCGGSLTPDATGGNGGGGPSSTGVTGSTAAVGTGGRSGTTTTGTTTAGATTTGVTTGGVTTSGTTSGVTTTGATTTSGTTTGGAGGTGPCAGGSCCDPAGQWPGFMPQPITITDCSDFDGDAAGLGVRCIMPGGIWSVDVDGVGTGKSESYKVEPCGTTGNGFHFVGQGHSIWGADVAAAIVSQTQPVDVSAFSGMSFVMKSTTANALIFKVQNSYSQPPCGKCDDTIVGAECYSGYIRTISLPAGSTAPIVVRFADLVQQSWGYKAPGTAMFDPTDLISVAFAFDKSIDFDVCLDDIKFVR